jgi:hypothetical protein
MCFPSWLIYTVVVPTAHPTQEAVLLSPSAASCNNCFAFMAIVPSQVQIPPSPQGERSTTVTRSATTAPVTTPALPSLSQLATFPSHMAAEDSTISFMANVPSPVTLPPVCIFQFLLLYPTCRSTIYIDAIHRYSIYIQ